MSATLSRALLEPLLTAIESLLGQRVRQALLSGLHNPFGRASALCDSWRFLDVCESAEIVDRVEALIGPDIVLWDSELYFDAATWTQARRNEGRHWPADPLAGAVVDLELATGRVTAYDVHAANVLPRGFVDPALPAPASGAHYVIRYMPATSFYNRDPLHAPNLIAMEERALVNFMCRPLWLVRGEDRAGSDFAAGFQAQAPGWAAATLAPPMPLTPPISPI